MRKEKEKEQDSKKRDFVRVCAYKDSTITAKEQKQSGQNKTYSTGRAKPWSKQYSVVMTGLCNKTCEACNNHQTKQF